MHLIYEALKKTNGDASGDALVGGGQGHVLDRARAARCRSIPRRATSIQTVYIREVKKVGDKLQNVIIEEIQDVKDPLARRREVSTRRPGRRRFVVIRPDRHRAVRRASPSGCCLFVLSVGLSVTLGLMNFVNLAHGAFGMLGGYIAVTGMRQLGLPFLAGLPAAFLAAAARQHRVRADAVSPALPGRRAQPGAVHDRPGVRGGRGRGLHLRNRQQPIQLPSLPARLGRDLPECASAPTGFSSSPWRC